MKIVTSSPLPKYHGNTNFGQEFMARFGEVYQIRVRRILLNMSKICWYPLTMFAENSIKNSWKSPQYAFVLTTRRLNKKLIYIRYKSCLDFNECIGMRQVSNPKFDMGMASYCSQKLENQKRLIYYGASVIWKEI